MSGTSRRRAAGAVLTLGFVLAAAACSDDAPAQLPPPGGTQGPSEASDVRAPNGTNMGAVPANQGTAAP